MPEPRRHRKIEGPVSVVYTGEIVWSNKKCCYIFGEFEDGGGGGRKGGGDERNEGDEGE